MRLSGSLEDVIYLLIDVMFLAGLQVLQFDVQQFLGVARVLLHELLQLDYGLVVLQEQIQVQRLLVVRQQLVLLVLLGDLDHLLMHVREFQPLLGQHPQQFALLPAQHSVVPHDHVEGPPLLALHFAPRYLPPQLRSLCFPLLLPPPQTLHVLLTHLPHSALAVPLLRRQPFSPVPEQQLQQLRPLPALPPRHLHHLLAQQHQQVPWLVGGGLQNRGQFGEGGQLLGGVGEEGGVEGSVLTAGVGWGPARTQHLLTIFEQRKPESEPSSPQLRNNFCSISESILQAMALFLLQPTWAGGPIEWNLSIWLYVNFIPNNHSRMQFGQRSYFLPFILKYDKINLMKQVWMRSQTNYLFHNCLHIIILRLGAIHQSRYTQIYKLFDGLVARRKLAQMIFIAIICSISKQPLTIQYTFHLIKWMNPGSANIQSITKHNNQLIKTTITIIPNTPNLLFFAKQPSNLMLLMFYYLNRLFLIRLTLKTRKPLSTLEEIIIYMEGYEQFVRYNNFVKDSIFQKLQTLITNKLLIESARQQQLQDLVRQIQRDLIRIKFDREEFQKQHPEIQIYVDVFKQMKEAVTDEYEACFEKLKDIEDNYLLTISRCRAADIAAQKKLLEYIHKREEEESLKISKLAVSIGKEYKRIDDLKLECFVSMLRFINSMSEDNIKAKFMNIEDQANSKFYGAQRSYMNELIEEIEAIEDQITQQIVRLRALEKDKNEFVAKASHKIYDLEKNKMKVIKILSLNFNPKYQIPEATFNQRLVINDSKMEFTSPKDYTKLNFIKKSKHLTLNSHKLNEALISHRHTMADFLVSRQTSLIIHQEKQKSIEKLQKDDTFGDYIKFLEEMQIAVKSKGNDEKKANDFLQKFIKTQGKKEYRQLLIFFLFEANRNKGQRLYAFNRQESELVKQMVDVFLLNCRELYDSQSALKMLMISYHVNLKDGGSLYLVLRENQIWKISEFWETSFIESVYEYFDVVVMFYHKELERNEKGCQTQTTNSNWFTNLFRFRPFWVTNSQEVEEPRNPLQQFYREIIKNLALIYVANMVLLFVQPLIIEKFKKYILDAVTHLQWSPQYIANLKKIFEVAINRGESSLKKLLSDSNVLERVMSKLLGANSQPKKETEMSLSKSIAMWIDEK